MHSNARLERQWPTRQCAKQDDGGGRWKTEREKKRSGNAGTRERKKRGREAKAADTDGQRTLGVGGRLERRGGGEAELVMTGAPAQGTGGGSAGSAGHAAPPRARRVACRTSSRLQDAPGRSRFELCLPLRLRFPRGPQAGWGRGLVGLGGGDEAAAAANHGQKGSTPYGPLSVSLPIPSS